MTITDFVSSILVAHELAPAAPGFAATSTTALPIGLGTKSLVTQAGLAYKPGQRVRLVSAADPNNYMEGGITEYAGTAMKVQVTRLGPDAAGIAADWSIVIAGDPGAGDMISTNALSEVDPAAAKVNLGTATKISFFGDSNNDITQLGQWPEFFVEMTPGMNWEPHYCAQSGLSAADLADQYAAKREEVRPKPGQRSVSVEATATNDIGAGVSALDIYNCKKSVWATMKGDGHEVWVQTVRRFAVMGTGGSWSGGYARAEEVNRLIRSDPTLYDMLIDGDVWFPDTLDYRYFSEDRGHLSLAGNYLYAQYVARNFQGLKSPVFAPYEARKANVLNPNPGMEVSQRYGTSIVPLTAGSHKILDGVEVQIIGSIAVNCSQSTDAPVGFKNSFLVSVTTPQPSLGATDLLAINIPIEDPVSAPLGFGTEHAQWLCGAVGVKGYIPGATCTATLTNRDGTYSYMIPFTIDKIDTWLIKEFAFPGCINGVWAHADGLGMIFKITLAAGSAMVGPAGVWSAPYSGVTGMTNGAASATAFLTTAVFLLPGTDVPPEGKLALLKPTYLEALENCRRRVRRVTSASAIAWSTSKMRVSIEHQGMSAPPASVTATGPLVFTDVHSAVQTQSAADIAIVSCTADAGQYDIGNFSGASALVFKEKYVMVPTSPAFLLEV